MLRGVRSDRPSSSTGRLATDPPRQQASKANMAATQHFCASTRYQAFTSGTGLTATQSNAQVEGEEIPHKMRPRTGKLVAGLSR